MRDAEQMGSLPSSPVVDRLLFRKGPLNKDDTEVLDRTGAELHEGFKECLEQHKHHVIYGLMGPQNHNSTYRKPAVI